MHTASVHTVAELRRQVAAWRRGGERVALVPTMGNLHAGHLALARHARTRADRVVASVFVNPLQFGEGEDFDSYPRTLEADVEALAGERVDLVFAPPVREVYPDGAPIATRVEVSGLSQILCGASRPQHFAGVTTVVALLFNLVQPDVAVFGQKDYQQLVIIRRMVADLHMPVEVVGVPTVREASGLAMSSRNQYLQPGERAVAPALYRTLRKTASRLEAGEMAFEALEQDAVERLKAAGFRPEYVAIRDADTLEPPGDEARARVVLAAAWLGRARLIDNVVIRGSR